MNKITDGKGSLVNRVESIKKLGIKTKKNILQNLLDKTELPAN